MGKEEKRHQYDAEILEKHVQQGDTEGGACLNRHVSYYARQSCSHRFQGRERASGEDRTWYEWPAYRAGVRAGLECRCQTCSPDGVKRGVVGPGHWDPQGAENYKYRCSRPFLHQAHHLIPNSVLNGCIMRAAESAERKRTPKLYKLIRRGLLEAKYNLNHKKNMIILPMLREYGTALRLPTHLRPGARDHPVYSNLARTMVNEVIAEYARVLDKGEDDKEHDAPPNKLARAKLERASKQLRVLVRSWGQISQGQEVDHHA